MYFPYVNRIDSLAIDFVLFAFLQLVFLLKYINFNHISYYTAKFPIFLNCAQAPFQQFTYVIVQTELKLNYLKLHILNYKNILTDKLQDYV